jgi:hypothetical protein
MSPENDNHLQPSAIESTPAERDPVSSPSEQPATVTPQQASAGAATAAVRAPAPLEPAAAEGSGTAQTVTGEVETAQASAAAAALSDSATATDESAESNETMDQLLDQFSAPPAANEGEIFDGRVLAVTDAGVVVDVGGKFEGLVPAREFVDTANPT